MRQGRVPGVSWADQLGWWLEGCLASADQSPSSMGTGKTATPCSNSDGDASRGHLFICTVNTIPMWLSSTFKNGQSPFLTADMKCIQASWLARLQKTLLDVSVRMPASSYVHVPSPRHPYIYLLNDFRFLSPSHTNQTLSLDQWQQLAFLFQRFALTNPSTAGPQTLSFFQVKT